ncbi:MAG: RNA methyltransferase [Chloroflexota bacterium]|nr:RNA methyltransferase [Chloroflexota bacterium]
MGSLHALRCINHVRTGAPAIITSVNNTTVKQIRQLRTRKERERTGTFYVEGIRIVAQAALSGAEIEACVISPGLLASEYAWEIVRDLRAKNVPVLELSPEAFGSISFKENLQGMGAVVRAQTERLEDVEISDTLGWVTLDHVGNPGNLGAILRTSDAVGCAGVVMLGDTTDPYHPAALRASMGAVFAQRLVRAEFDEFLRWKQEHGHTVVGTSGDAEKEYRDVSYPRPVLVLMGSERMGLSAEQQAMCDLTVRIPMVGTGDSLNLAVATSVVLYEAFHQHRTRAGSADGTETA